MSMWESSLSNTLLQLIPFRKRKAKYMAWIKVFVSYIHNIFISLRNNYRPDTIRLAYMTPQVNMIEEYLKDATGSDLIEIIDGEILGPWLFTDHNDNEFYLDQATGYVFNPEDSYDFNIRVATGLSDEVTQYIAAIVNKFKLPGKNFIITKDLTNNG